MSRANSSAPEGQSGSTEPDPARWPSGAPPPEPLPEPPLPEPPEPEPPEPEPPEPVDPPVPPPPEPPLPPEPPGFSRPPGCSLIAVPDREGPGVMVEGADEDAPLALPSPAPSPSPPPELIAQMASTRSTTARNSATALRRQ
ncbi:hypothetical protein FF041_37555 [Streptomyces jumonjinensis]|uniref:Uncharacterized protein n=1 Tax=Streptomyces jumonjinensis TaxID=1945 RepID=A0A646KU87_STRJU|nr:hypothetical protein [Streptomyces jumonjinensis]